MTNVNLETDSVGVILGVFGIAFMLLSWAVGYLNFWWGILGALMLVGAFFVAMK